MHEFIVTWGYMVDIRFNIFNRMLKVISFFIVRFVHYFLHGGNVFRTSLTKITDVLISSSIQVFYLYCCRQYILDDETVENFSNEAKSCCEVVSYLFDQHFEVKEKTLVKHELKLSISVINVMSKLLGAQILSLKCMIGKVSIILGCFCAQGGIFMFLHHN